MDTSKNQRSASLFFTFTLNPTVFKKVPEPKNQLGTFNQLIPILKNTKFFGDIYAEVTKAQNIHYHGYGTFEYPSNIKYGIDWFKRQIKNKCDLFGFTDITNTKDEMKVQAYCQKDHERSIEIIGKHRMWTDDKTETEYNIDMAFITITNIGCCLGTDYGNTPGSGH